MAYDAWATYVFDRLDIIKHWTEFDLAQVYPTDREAQLTNLAGYFVKQIGCQLAHARIRVPADLIDFLDGRIARPRRVHAFFGISDGTLALQDRIRAYDADPTEGLFIRRVVCDYRPSANAIAETAGGFGFSYIEVLWHVKHIDEPEPGRGSCFGTARQGIARGYEVDPDEALKKLAGPGA